MHARMLAHMEGHGKALSVPSAPSAPSVPSVPSVQFVQSVLPVQSVEPPAPPPAQPQTDGQTGNCQTKAHETPARVLRILAAYSELDQDERRLFDRHSHQPGAG